MDLSSLEIQGISEDLGCPARTGSAPPICAKVYLRQGHRGISALIKHPLLSRLGLPLAVTQKTLEESHRTQEILFKRAEKRIHRLYRQYQAMASRI